MDDDILARALKSGAYELHEVTATASPSMDIQVASNFERALFEAMDRDARAVRTMMAALVQSRRFVIPARALAELRASFSADCADEQETAATIRTVRREAGYLVDPHTAVAIAVAEKEHRDAAAPMVVLSTAHPAKFPARSKLPAGLPALPEVARRSAAQARTSNRSPADQTAVERFAVSAA